MGLKTSFLGSDTDIWASWKTVRKWMHWIKLNECWREENELGWGSWPWCCRGGGREGRRWGWEGGWGAEAPRVASSPVTRRGCHSSPVATSAITYIGCDHLVTAWDNCHQNRWSRRKSRSFETDDRAEHWMLEMEQAEEDEARLTSKKWRRKTGGCYFAATLGKEAQPSIHPPPKRKYVWSEKLKS